VFFLPKRRCLLPMSLSFIRHICSCFGEVGFSTTYGGKVFYWEGSWPSVRERADVWDWVSETVRWCSVVCQSTRLDPAGSDFPAYSQLSAPERRPLSLALSHDKSICSSINFSASERAVGYRASRVEWGLMIRRTHAQHCSLRRRRRQVVWGRRLGCSHQPTNGRLFQLGLLRLLRGIVSLRQDNVITEQLGAARAVSHRSVHCLVLFASRACSHRLHGSRNFIIITSCGRLVEVRCRSLWLATAAGGCIFVANLLHTVCTQIHNKSK